ncbi:hypothetical protein B0J18DRAFT_51481 [Chaetomium sp. MPI-SDFR-AT-0129]|nr:hypothetical protein B0J18DRAFT_51481 [Chaetomium sp. MPI-SDFR-AT-0129]
MSSVHDLCQNYVANAADSNRAEREVRRLVSDPNNLPEQPGTQSLLPVEDMELRLQYIGKLEDLWREKFTYLTGRPEAEYQPFSDFQVAALVQMDLAVLRRSTNENGMMNEVLRSIKVVTTALKIFATKTLSNLEIADLGPTGHSTTGPPFKPEPISESEASDSTTGRRKTSFQAGGKIRRSDFYAKKRQTLDGPHCIITRLHDPHICHIIPFAADSGEEARSRWGECLRSVANLYIIETEVVENADIPLTARLQTLFSSELGVSDRPWNTISLTPTLHDWWGKAYFGLKCLGTCPADSGDPDQTIALRLQFHWMVWRERDTGKKPSAPLRRSKESFLAAFRPSCGNADPSSLGGVERPSLPTINRSVTGISVESGDVLKVSVPKKHVKKMILAFDLQWALIKLLAMGGGAEAIDEAPDDSKFLDEFWEFPGITAETRRIYAMSDAVDAKDKQHTTLPDTTMSEDEEEDIGEGPSGQGMD